MNYPDYSMKNLQLIVLTFLTFLNVAYAQRPALKVGNNPATINNTAALEIESTTKGFLPPRMTSAQMLAISSPTQGLIVYCTDCNPLGLRVNNGSSTAPNWESIGGGGTSNLPVVNAVSNISGFNNGIYETGKALNSGRGYFVTLVNNTFGNVTIPFSSTDLVLSGVSGLTVGTPVALPVLSSGQITLAMSQSVTVFYPISGTPSSCGVLRGVWTKAALSLDKTISIRPAGFDLFASNLTQTGKVINGFNANWTNVSGATGYTVEYGTSEQGPWTPFPGNPYTGTSAAITGLNAERYWFRVTPIGSGACLGNPVVQGVECYVYDNNLNLLTFKCHNLGADLNGNPRTPNWSTNGGYVRYGSIGAGRGNWFNAPNATGFWGPPTASNPNYGNIDVWNTGWTGDWGVTNSGSDPCPVGYRVPSTAEYSSIIGTTPFNAQVFWNNVGTWTEGATSYTSGKLVNDVLFLPAAGARNGDFWSSPFQRGVRGLYWTRNGYPVGSEWWGAHYLNFYQASNSMQVTNLDSFTFGLSIRCIAAQ